MRPRSRSVLVAYALLAVAMAQVARGPPVQLPALRKAHLPLREPGGARAGSAVLRPLATTPSSGTRRFCRGCAGAPTSQQRGVLGRARRLKDCAPVRVALPQDEFLRSDGSTPCSRSSGVRARFLGGPGVGVAEDLRRPRSRARRTLARAHRVPRRARRWRAHSGSSARAASARSTSATAPCPASPTSAATPCSRREIAEVIRERAEARGLRVDISTRAEDTFYGDDWYRFLASCRYTIGIEGGASILDRDGSVRACVESRLEEKPAAGFAELEAACFPGRDGELELYAISPRHLEACATRTAQILVEGDYGGILQPGRALLRPAARPVQPRRRAGPRGRATADARRPQLADSAYRDVVASGQYTYRRLVEEVERELPSPAPAGRHSLTARASGAVDAAVAAAHTAGHEHADAGTAAPARRERRSGLPAGWPRARGSRASAWAACW